MKFPVRIEPRDGAFVAHSLGDPVCTVRGTTRSEAIEKIRLEIRYRVEYCPCTGVEDDFVEIVEV